MNYINYRGATITINDKEIKFNHDIFKYIEIDNIIIILLKRNSNDKNNVFGIYDGKIIWQIQSVLDLYPNFHQMSYVGIKKYEDGNIIVTDFGGSRFIVNPQNGKIIDTATETR
ncbi:MAG: hypothetical protein AAGU14_11580 [Eubacteriaceae bacterium]